MFTKGMTWENHGHNGWHIDHIIPCSFFKYESFEDISFQYCWSLENLQPLWATTEIAIQYGEDESYIGNLEKSNKVTLTKEQQKIVREVHKKRAPIK